MLNLAVATYPLENLGLCPKPTMPTTTWHHEDQLRFCCSPQPSRTSEGATSLLFPTSQLRDDSWQAEEELGMGSRGAWKSEAAEAAVCTYGGVHLPIWILYCSADLYSCHKPQVNRADRDLGDYWIQSPHFTDKETEMWRESGKDSSTYCGLIVCFRHTSQAPQPASGDHTGVDEHFHPTQASVYSFHTHSTGRKGLDI